MKKDNNKKRWFYDLTQKQIYKIVAVFEVVFFIIIMSSIAATWSVWTNEQLWEQRGMNIVTGIIFTITFLFCSMVVLGLLIWFVLWENPGKQFYLFWKEHDEKIVPKVREKFGLCSEFKEVLHKTDYQMHWFAKETEEGIMISQRNQNGKEIESKLIKNYNYFDLHYKPIE